MYWEGVLMFKFWEVENKLGVLFNNDKLTCYAIGLTSEAPVFKQLLLEFVDECRSTI